MRPPAQTGFNEIDVETLEVAGGHLVIFNELDKRYPPKTLEDKLGDALEAALNFKFKTGEEPPEFTGRAATVFDKLFQYGVDLPTQAKAYMVLKAAPLDKSETPLDESESFHSDKITSFTIHQKFIATNSELNDFLQENYIKRTYA